MLHSRIILFYVIVLSSFVYGRLQQLKLEYRRLVNVKLSRMLQGRGRGLFKILSRHLNHENCVCVCVCLYVR